MSESVAPASAVGRVRSFLRRVSGRIWGAPKDVRRIAFAPTLLAWTIFASGHLAVVGCDWIGVHLLHARPFAMGCIDHRVWPLYLVLIAAVAFDLRSFRGFWGAALALLLAAGQLLAAIASSLLFFTVVTEIGPYAGSACRIGDL